MEGKELKKLKEAAETRNVSKISSLVMKISPQNIKCANKILSKFYDHEVSVANAVLDVIAYSKIYKTKVKPPLKGCFCFKVSER